MDSSERREILTKVANGQLTPEEAADQLGQAGPEPQPARSSLARVRIDTQLGSIDVVGDPTVREAVADGPHQARIEGDTLVIQGQQEELGAFAFIGGRPWGLGADSDHRLLVRMNPALALELDAQAGTCRVRGIEGPIRADVQAGSLKIDGFRSPLQVSVQAGSLKASGMLCAGDSRITCEAGSVNIHLERGSSVRITARTSLGKVTLPGPAGPVAGRGAPQATIGAGAATLSIEGSMGSVTVTAEA